MASSRLRWRRCCLFDIFACLSILSFISSEALLVVLILTAATKSFWGVLSNASWTLSPIMYVSFPVELNWLSSVLLSSSLYNSIYYMYTHVGYRYLIHCCPRRCSWLKNCFGVVAVSESFIHLTCHLVMAIYWSIVMDWVVPPRYAELSCPSWLVLLFCHDHIFVFVIDPVVVFPYYRSSVPEIMAPFLWKFWLLDSSFLSASICDGLLFWMLVSLSCL